MCRYKKAPDGKHIVDCSAAFPYGPSANGTSRDCAYAVLNDKDIPWQGTIGDHLGLFPVAYLRRFQHSNTPEADDAALAITTARKYVVPYPNFLPPSSSDTPTFSRVGGDPNQPAGKPTFLWADDQVTDSTRSLPRLPCHTAPYHTTPPEVLRVAH